ncbi:hypothetical protein [Halobacterium salinarum]|uniref:hypothetical protein n=1 Tax=Halobacterium salinarum TaxID=2242 RepID=UPI0025536F72|nr:hypothetical protein [Halobacterium salinarum]MDL0127043.1 hypothetical protein [Halobacterium salinarum]
MPEDSPRVEIPAWVASEALQEFDVLIKRTGGDDPQDGEAVTPLALVQQRLEELDGEGIDEYTLRQVQQHVQGVAEERGVQLGDVDPLTGRTFEARDALESALEEPIEPDGEAVLLSPGSEIVECVACGRTGIKARIQPTACPHDSLDDLEEGDA